MCILPFQVPSFWMNRMEDPLVLFLAHVRYLQHYFRPTSHRRILGENLTAAQLGNENSPHFMQLEGPSVAVLN
jgi:hypothetical protein